MHACGHDGHVAVGLTVARMLHERRAQLKGAVKLVFQPAEEGLGGASDDRQRRAGKPAVATTLALHLWNERPVGWVGVTSGPLMAGADIFLVRLAGKGGHGALPHEPVDPLLAAAQVVSALQSIVARNVSPLDTGRGQRLPDARRGGVQRHPAVRRAGRNLPDLHAAGAREGGRSPVPRAAALMAAATLETLRHAQ
jgi:metal-dependent amidase/aminoacylase/carboxypeptidase family protein